MKQTAIKAVIVAAICFVIGFVVGYGLSASREVPVADSPTGAVIRPVPSPDAPMSKRKPTAKAAIDLSAAATCEERERFLAGQIRDLNRKAFKQSEQMAELFTEAYGVPVPWPDQMQEKYSPKGFESILQEVIESCALPYELVRMDCSEPPCLAAIRITGVGDNSLTGCPAWQKHFGNTFSGASGVVIDCGDDTEEEVMFPQAPWTERYNEMSASEKKNASKRFHYRLKQLKDGWECRSGK